MTEPDHFTCAECGQTFPKLRTDAEAWAEARARWGDAMLGEDAAVLCDDCHTAVLNWWTQVRAR